MFHESVSLGFIKMRYAREISGVSGQFFMQAHKRFLKTICACLLLPPILFLNFFLFDQLYESEYFAVGHEKQMFCCLRSFLIEDLFWYSTSRNRILPTLYSFSGVRFIFWFSSQNFESPGLCSILTFKLEYMHHHLLWKQTTGHIVGFPRCPYVRS